jgi:hypothetical protein
LSLGVAVAVVAWQWVGWQWDRWQLQCQLGVAGWQWLGWQLVRVAVDACQWQMHGWIKEGRGGCICAWTPPRSQAKR